MRFGAGIETSMCNVPPVAVDVVISMGGRGVEGREGEEEEGSGSGSGVERVGEGVVDGSVVGGGFVVGDKGFVSAVWVEGSELVDRESMFWSLSMASRSFGLLLNIPATLS